jgi:hypothetical protein
MLSPHPRTTPSAQTSLPYPGTMPSARSSPLSGPRHPTVTTTPGKHVILPTVTATGSTPPDCHRCHQEPHRPPDRHRRWVHAVRSSPPPGPHLPYRFHLQQFGKPSPSVNSILLYLDVCLYDYAYKLINLSFVSMPMMIFQFLLI